MEVGIILFPRCAHAMFAAALALAGPRVLRQLRVLRVLRGSLVFKTGGHRKASVFAAARMLAVQRTFFLLIAYGAVCVAQSQEPNSPEKPQVRVNVLNVCTPSKEEQQEISSALAKVPKKPSFSADFEVDRGRSLLDPTANPLTAAGTVAPGAQVQPDPASSQPASAEFVRIRHDFASSLPFSNVQYSFSRDKEQMVETLVFRLRDPKDVLQISIESNASSVTTPSAMLNAATPAGRVKIERFGKSSVVLARCTGADGKAVDQGPYEPLFSSASSILSDYRRALGASKLIPEELAKLGGQSLHRKAPTPGAVRKN